MTLGDGTVIEYLIDAQSRRVGRKVNGTVTHTWLYADQLRIISETDHTRGGLVKRFVYAARSNAPSYMSANGTYYRIFTDHLGSVREVFNTSTQTVVQSLRYDEFGYVLTDTNAGLVPFAFAGGLYDLATRLTRFGARDYDARAGRWTAKDPIRFGGGDGNLYAYTGGDPINFVDPNGLTIYPADFIGPLKPGDVISRAGTPFASPNDAARAALTEICATSVREDREYGGYIYLWDQFGKYYYTQPVQGEQHGLPWKGTVPDGATKVGDYHSHGAESGREFYDEVFSPLDIAVINLQKVRGYLVTPQAGC